ncbi:MAG: patatin-like phospholipase family protein [Gammaproteobacteria bacterium]
MLDLAEIPFFAPLSAASLTRLRSRIPTHHYEQGSIIARVGEPGQYFQAIASGAVRVLADTDAPGGWRGFVLGPGQVFGEMSLFTGMPIAATLVATRDTVTYRLKGEDFLALLDVEPQLHHSLTRLLIERLRFRTRNDARLPGMAVVVNLTRDLDVTRFTERLFAGVLRYAPGSRMLGLEAGGQPGAAPFDLQRLERWRDTAAAEQYLVAVVSPGNLHAIASELLPEDVVIELVEHDSDRDETVTARRRAGAAAYSRVFIDTRPRGEDARWSFCVPREEIDRAAAEPTAWRREDCPNLDHVARYITFSEVGVALSSGAARGFAHVGVLETLEAEGIPVDFICGTSMGGIVALTMAASDSAAEGGRKVREFLGGNRKIRDLAWWPRTSLFSGGKVERAARRVFGEVTFADLRLPAAIVASDLISADRAVVDSGPVLPAVLGTSAIPGFYPPMTAGDRMMVDGAIVSRVPVDVLERRRCGVRIAVNVVAVPASDQEYHDFRRRRLHARAGRLFGFRSVLGASWELLGSYGSSIEALRADLVITPETYRCGGVFDFDRFEVMIACGREATLARIDAVRGTVRAMLDGGYR